MPPRRCILWLDFRHGRARCLGVFQAEPFATLKQAVVALLAEMERKGELGQPE